MGFDLAEAQQELANRLGVEKKTDVIDILVRFCQCTKREPRFISTYRENDGSMHSGTGSLFDREKQSLPVYCAPLRALSPEVP
ncbi:MAG: hypothetical protein HFF39_03905 [Lawsonibacter sp.]|nr:hypothetical protein [Lawsonibacter sp.]